MSFPSMTDILRDIIRKHSRPLEPVPTGVEPVLRPLPGIRAVLFDIYGTLFISGVGEIGTAGESQCSRAMQEALAACGLAVDPPAQPDASRLREAIQQSHEASRQRGIEHPEVEIRLIWRTILDRLMRDGLISRVEVGETLLERLAVEYEVRSNPVWPMPGCRQTLEALAAGGLRLGLISNAQFFTPELFPALLEADLDELRIPPELQILSYRHGEAKPGRLLFDLARRELARHGVQPDDTLYVGNDMLNDIFAASQCGFRTALFAGDERSLRLRRGDRQVEGVQPDLIITQLSQIIKCVQSETEN